MPQNFFNPISSWGANNSVNTGSPGSAFVSLPNIPADEVTIINPGVALDIACASTDAPGQFVTIGANSGIVINVVANAMEIQVRRNDKSATGTNVQFIWRKYK
jgi:hypothetical protein